jgi:hypothetical protein
MNAVPMRWPVRPQEHWSKPGTLEILAGTPVNCLILPDAAGAEGWQPLIERATAAGLKVLRSETRLQADGVLVLDKSVWPSVLGFGRQNGNSAGPTGNAWVDSNGWRIRLAQERAPGRAVWLTYSPPARSEIPAEAYVMAVADAATYGARWVISLDETLATGLAQGSPRSIEVWKRLTAAAGFFERHAEWGSFPAVANLGVLSAFSGPNEAFAGEVLNLASRRHQLYRVLLAERARSDSYDGLSAIIYADRVLPEDAVQKKLSPYVEGGGLLVGPPALRAMVPQAAKLGEVYPRYNLYRFGKGRIAIADKEPTDPYLLASDTQLILSRRHDPLRVWNGGSMNIHVTASPDGSRTLVQVLNYSLRDAGHEASFQLKDPYRIGRLLRIDAGSEEPIKPVRAAMGTEVHLPGIPVYAAVELTK